MHLPPFLLDHWIAQHDFASVPVAYNLASSTGPRWTLAELAQLGGASIDLAAMPLGYAPPQGSASLRQAVADFHGVDPDWVVMTTGGSEALLVLLCLAQRPGGNLVMPDPAYPAYAAVAQAWGLSTRAYTLSAAESFTQSSATILRAVDKDTAAVIVNTPHNPTGSVMPLDEIASLAAALAPRGIPLIVDEVYHPLYFGPPQPTAARLPGVVVMSDLSKALSLPGLRTGWLIDQDAERRRRAIDARSYFTVSSSPLLETLAAHALRQSGAILARLAATANRNITEMDALIAGSGGALSWVRPQGGTTCFPWFTDGRNGRDFCMALAARGVLVVPGDCFGRPAHLRIGVAQQEAGFADAAGIILDTLRA